MSAILLHAWRCTPSRPATSPHLAVPRRRPRPRNPPAQAPPGLTGPVNTIIGWGKWGVLVCGVAAC